MLRLVQPAPAGQGLRTRKGRRQAPSLSLTTEEARHLRATLKNAVRAYGGAPVLASVMGVPLSTIHQASSPKRLTSGTFAIRLAKAAGVSVESVLTGALNAAGRCATCGHRAGDGRAVLAAGGAR